jgi:hypothetical protein
MNGMRLLGMPLGSSPIRPLGFAPTGLKYREQHGRELRLAAAASRMICSINSFVLPYGMEQGPVFISTVSGSFSGTPYTVAEELENERVNAEALHRLQRVSAQSRLFAVIAQRLPDRLADSLEPGEMDDAVNAAFPENVFKRFFIGDVRAENRHAFPRQFLDTFDDLR